jgi:ribosomal 50S subunit-recycling heat shock protein
LRISAVNPHSAIRIPQSFVRLDLYLKASRLVLRRTVAQQLCDAGLVAVNGAAAKSSRAVKVGDEITLRRRDRTLAARILAVPAAKNVARHDAATLYEIISETIHDDSLCS